MEILSLVAGLIICCFGFMVCLFCGYIFMKGEGIFEKCMSIYCFCCSIIALSYIISSGCEIYNKLQPKQQIVKCVIEKPNENLIDLK